MQNLYLQGISIEAMKSLIKEAVEEVVEKKQLQNTSEQKEPLPREKTYLTINEVCDLLQVSKVTLHKWSVEGLIPSFRISNRIRYKREDILNSLTEVKSLKYKRN